MTSVLARGGPAPIRFSQVLPRPLAQRGRQQDHPGGNPGANLKSIFQRCHPMLVAFVRELTKETINLPPGCLQGGESLDKKAAPSTTDRRASVVLEAAFLLKPKRVTRSVTQSGTYHNHLRFTTHLVRPSHLNRALGAASQEVACPVLLLSRFTYCGEHGVDEQSHLAFLPSGGGARLRGRCPSCLGQLPCPRRNCGPWREVWEKAKMVRLPAEEGRSRWRRGGAAEWSLLLAEPAPLEGSPRRKGAAAHFLLGTLAHVHGNLLPGYGRSRGSGSAP